MTYKDYLISVDSSSFDKLSYKSRNSKGSIKSFETHVENLRNTN